MPSAIWVCYFQTGIKAVHANRSCQQDPSHCIYRLTSRETMLEKSKGGAKFSTAIWAPNVLVSLENPPFLCKNNRITTVSRSSYRQAAGDGFLCALAVPEGTVTTSSPHGLSGRWDMSRNQGHERTWWPREGQEQVKEMESSWFNRLSDSLGGETSA